MSRRLLSSLPYGIARLGEFSYPPGTLIKYLNEVQPGEAWPENCITHGDVLEDVDAATNTTNRLKCHASSKSSIGRPP